jgi:hypothetical protein
MTSPAVQKLPVISKSRRVAGRILSGIAVLFIAFGMTTALAQRPEAIEGAIALGYPPSTVFWIGVLEFVLLVLYLIPRTAVLGAVLWTGYLGGAVASHVRLQQPWFSTTLFPIYFAILLWGGLYLRDRRVAALIQPK